MPRIQPIPFRVILIALLLAACVAPHGLVNPLQAQEARETPGEGKRLTFEQEKALAHMKELEQRMFRLAQTIRQAQPEDAARLKMGVRRSRDELVTQRMEQTARLLSAMDLRTARDKQQAILKDLDKLKALLLTADLELQLKLEQLRKMREAMKDIEKLIDKEKAQRTKTGELADENADRQKPLFDLLEKDEQRNAQTAENIEREVKALGEGASKQAGKVAGAGKDMKGAAGKLGKGKAGGAKAKQQDAIDKLQNARDHIAEARKNLQDEIEQEVRKKVMEHLKQMLADQTSVREATQTLAPKLEQANDQAVVAMQRLAKTQDNITDLAEETIKLVKETGFSVTLAPTLDAIKYPMVIVSDDLRTAAADKKTIEREKRIEHQLSQLVDAMKASNKASDPNANPNNQPPGANKQRKEMNKLLAEVRMLKIMQVAVNRATEDVEQMRRQGVSTSVLNRRYQQVKNQQNAVETTTRQLDEFARKKQQQR